MKGNEVLFDTNVLVYAYDTSEEEKRAACSGLISEVFSGKSAGAVSSQVLAEVFYVLTTKVRKPLSAAKANEIILTFLKSENWLKINYNEGTLEKSMGTAINSRVDFWDVLIAETMKENGIVKIYTENEKDFGKISGIRTINPFR